MSERAVTPVLVVVGVLHLATGLWMMIDPGGFQSAIADYRPRNDHFVRDLSTYFLASGVVALLAVRRAAWRGAVLTVLAIQYAAHSLAHIIDVDKAPTHARGVRDAVTFGVLAAILTLLARTAARPAP